MLALVLAAALAAALAAVPGPARGAAGRIEIARQVTVAGEEMRLGDVAELSGDAQALAATALGRAPAPGESLRLSGESILRCLRAAGLDDATVYTIPAWVRVTRAWQDIPDHELREAIRERVEPVLAAGESIDEIALPATVRAPLGAYAIAVEDLRAAGAGDRRRKVDVRIEQEGEVVARVTARIGVAASAPVVVARHAIERGAVLRAEDVDVAERSLAGAPPSALREVSDAIGKQTRVALAGGRPIVAQSLVARAAVRKGDPVRVIIDTPALRLSVPGEALQDGGEGDPVRVRNASSGKELTAEVVAHGVVLVAPR